MAFIHYSTELLFLLCGISDIVMCQNCFGDPVQHDKYMEQRVFRKLASSSLYDCASECRMSSVCLSFAFQHKTRTCFLNSNSSAQVSISSRSGFDFSDIQLWTKALSGPCAVMSCPVATSCQVDRHGRAICVPEFTGCGLPPDVPFASVTYDGHFKGAVANYTCKKDYTACHQSNTSVCQASEEWSNVTDLCRKFRWRNPWVGGRYDMPCGPQSKFSVLVLATPNTTESYSLNMRADADWPFHAKFTILRNEIVINSKIRDSWDTELVQGIKTKVGKESHTQISLHNGVYKLMVDDVVMELPERQPGMLPDRISFEGDIRISLIEFSV